MYISLLIIHMHILPHIPLFARTLPFCLFHIVLVFFSFLFSITYLCPTDHSVTATAPYKNHTSCPHLFQLISDDTCKSSGSCVLYSTLSYNVAVLCYIAFVIVLKEKQSCLDLCLSSLFGSLWLLSVSSLCYPPFYPS